ncbi:peptidoglycan DD-metalloendopeptidase family protein [Dermabacter hominis]|uniref:peptidoglycan DD-metalloendopeptidase family protein n=1 Tax=Dermabacter hominis TaxID=36740 RepID=UPI0021A7D6A8|nr:peptidoglycan DD-metalloendopeptidase family protein [Dermabacter hominis]MCT1955578.1 peptidoglycan DD-metalloendopeptidase family protein [Dermabacter hominis]
MKFLSRRALVKGASFAAVLGLASSGIFSHDYVLADDIDDKKKQKKSVDEKLAALREDLNEVDTELADAYLALAETEARIPDAQARLDSARSALEAAKAEDARQAKRLENAQAEESEIRQAVESGQQKISQSNEDVSRASIEAYKGTSAPNPASIFVNSENPQDAVDRTMNYRLTLQAQGAKLTDLRGQQATNVNSADRLEAIRAEIEDLKKKSAAAVAERRQAENEAAQAKKDLDGLYASQKSQAANLETLKDKYRASESALESQSSALETDIQQLIEKERQEALARQREQERKAREAREAEKRRAKRERRKPRKIAAPKPESGGGASSGGFRDPVSARRSSMFGYRFHPVYHTRKLHKGMDYAAACGTPVGAMAAGKVLATTHSRGAGNKVIVSHGLHNGQILTTSYHHLQGFAVSAGQRLEAGQTVGYVGSTGASTGCHLHFETHLDGTALDPRKFVGY